MYELACNYNPLATCDDGSCILPDGCTDDGTLGQTWWDDNGYAASTGIATYPAVPANNYDPTANCDDGSCEYGSTTGVGEEVSGLLIYPNPATNVLNVVSSSHGINTVSIYSVNGQEVLTSKVDAIQVKLDISELSPGLYIIDIKSNNITTKRMFNVE